MRSRAVVRRPVAPGSAAWRLTQPARVLPSTRRGTAPGPSTRAADGRRAGGERARVRPCGTCTLSAQCGQVERTRAHTHTRTRAHATARAAPATRHHGARRADRRCPAARPAAWLTRAVAGVGGGGRDCSGGGECRRGRHEGAQAEESDAGAEDPEALPEHMCGRKWRPAHAGSQGAGVAVRPGAGVFEGYGDAHVGVEKRPSAQLNARGGGGARKRAARTTVRAFNIRRNEKIAVGCTVRGPKAEELLDKGLRVKEYELPSSSFSDNGIFGFGVEEHIDLGIKYDPAMYELRWQLLLTAHAPIRSRGTHQRHLRHGLCCCSRPARRDERRPPAAAEEPHGLLAPHHEGRCAALLPAEGVCAGRACSRVPPSVSADEQRHNVRACSTMASCCMRGRRRFRSSRTASEPQPLHRPSCARASRPLVSPPPTTGARGRVGEGGAA